MPKLSNIMPPRVAFIDQNTNDISREWYRFLFDQFTDVKNGATSYDTPPVPLTVGTSPYTYQNTSEYAADVLISGGGVMKVEFSRGGVTFYDTGSYYGMFQLSPYDMIRVTYQVAPTMTVIPR